MKRRNFIKASFALGTALAASDVLTRLAARPMPGLPGAAHAPAGVWSGKPLIFLPDRISSLRKRIARGAVTPARWGRFLKRADDLAAGTHLQLGDAPGQTNLMLGLAWRMTGDERYANKLREGLLKSASTQLKPGADADNHTPPWHSWLQTAALVAGCVLGREALEGFLSAAERRQVTEGMTQYGLQPILDDWILPRQRIHALDSMGHNWWSVCVSGAGLGALALLGEEVRAADWLGEIETALAGFFDYQGMVLLNKSANFDPAGAFYESVGYANYALESCLIFRLARTNAITVPPPEIPVLNRIAEFFVQTLYPAATGDLAINFGDSSLKPAAAPTMRLLALLGFSPESTRWYLQRMDPDSIDPLALLYLEDTAASSPISLPNSASYPAIGWATMRDSWSPDATLLGVKCGFTWNHAHADAGSFVLYHGGQPLLIDSGRCGYARSEYLDYYCQSRAHNVVLFNGQGQPLEDIHDRGVKFPGHVHDLLDGLDVKYIYADATGPMARYLSRNYRHWLWIDGVILIYDDLRAHEPGQFDWLLHYAGQALVTGAAVALSNGPAKATLTMLFPPNPVIQEASGLAADAPEVKIKYLKLSTPGQTREQKFLVAIVPQPDRGAAPLPEIELVEETNALGVSIKRADQITEVYWNLNSDGRRMHANSNNIINQWETDAYLLALTRPKGAGADLKHLRRFFVAGCSYLRRDGQSALDSFSKVTGVFRPGDQTEILIHGQPHLDLSVVGFQKPASLRVNGQRTPFEFDPARQTVQLMPRRL